MDSKKYFVLIIVQLFIDGLVVLSNNLSSDARKYVVRQQQRREGYGFMVSDHFDMDEYREVVTTDYYGVILRKNVVLAKNTLFRKMKENYIIYGTITNVTRSKKIKKSVQWKKVIKYNETAKDDEPQLILIQLKENMHLDSVRAKAINLPTKDYEPGMVCDVIDEDEDLWLHAEQETIMFRNDCKQFIPNLHENNFCIRSSTIYYDGAIVVCNNTLVGILNSLEEVDEEQPYTCTSIYQYRDWIKSEMKKIPEISDLAASIRWQPIILFIFFLIRSFLEIQEAFKVFLCSANGFANNLEAAIAMSSRSTYNAVRFRSSYKAMRSRSSYNAMRSKSSYNAVF
uniref:Peptidase S1 domain-containing protein n=1 Tax=Glossina brevipalpis TaxID=37001 RepID=A0A1A9WZV3_9MUSC